MLQTTYKVKQFTNQNKATLINTAFQLIIMCLGNAGNNSRSPDKILKNNVQSISYNDLTEHLTSTSWLIFFKVLSVNKLCLVKFAKCLTKKKTWKDLCPVNKEKLFPALLGIHHCMYKLCLSHVLFL